jgi:hypothetical protein
MIWYYDWNTVLTLPTLTIVPKLEKIDPSVFQIKIRKLKCLYWSVAFVYLKNVLFSQFQTQQIIFGSLNQQIDQLQIAFLTIW